MHLQMRKKYLLYFFRPLVLTMLLALYSCQNPETLNSILKIYVDNPALYYALLIYQQRIDSRPLSIHLQKGLNIFFQLSGAERPIDAAGLDSIIGSQANPKMNGLDKSSPRLSLGGGLFLSSELTQLQDLQQVFQELPEKFLYSNLRSQTAVVNLGSSRADQSLLLDLSNSKFLSPILLFPTLFELEEQENIGYQQQDLDNALQQAAKTFPDKVAAPIQNPVLRNLAQSGLARLLHESWLKEQLLAPAYLLNTGGSVPAANSKQYTHLLAPRWTLLDFLGTTPLRLGFSRNGFSSNQADLEPEIQEFIDNYRQLFFEEDEDTSQTKHQAEQETEQRLSKAATHFAEQQQELYQEQPRDYLLSYRSTTAPVDPASYPYIYFRGALLSKANSATGSRGILELQLDKVLWGGISKGLSDDHQEQALRFLSWLQSREGQMALQQELPKLGGDSMLGIYQGLSLYPEVNVYFWKDLRLDWPNRFAIRWLLPHTIVQWDNALFRDLSFEQEKLYRQQSAASIMNSFLLPYLFLPEGQEKVRQQKKLSTHSEEKLERAGKDKIGTEFHQLDWGLWLQSN